MSVITLFSGSYCYGEEVARKVAETLGYTLIDDRTLIAETGKRFQIEEDKLFRVLMGKTSIFNKFTHEKERSLACMKVVAADFMKQTDLLFYGFTGLLIPKEISHVLKVCAIAEMPYRIRVAMEKEKISEKEAAKRIHKDDESRVLWMEYLFNDRDPWSPKYYDIVIPMDKSNVEDAAELICENIRKDVLSVTEASRKAVEDFMLASQVNLELAKEGHDVSVSAKSGKVTLTINKNVLRLSALEEDLKKIVRRVPDVQDVETKTGPGYFKSDIYRKYDFDLPLPSKVLLVDDEREFAQTLSERLLMREVGSAVVYDGEEALSAVEEEEPEVMVLDLKMPGIDGIEVLKRVRSEHPGVEVIVLTGHGSGEIEKQCMQLGAFAYLEKPVDIDKLTEIMQEAYRKVKVKKNKV